MTSRNARAFALAALAYTALTLAYTWPLATNLVHGVPHDAGDPILNAWILWWSTQAAPLTSHWWNAPIFYPAPGALAFSEHLLGQAPIAAPVIAVSGSALLGYNVTLIATYVLSGLGAYFLAFTLTKRHDAAFVAGLAFAFAPYRLAQVPHIQVLCSYWSPVCLAALHRYDRDPRTSWAALAGVAWLMQALSNGYYLFFLSVLLLLWFAWFAVGRWPLKQFVRLAGFFVVAAMLLAPFLLGYKHILVDLYGLRRGFDEMRAFSADVASLLQASGELLLWGWVRFVPKSEGELFPGPTIAILAVCAVLAARPFSASVELTPARRRIRLVFGTLAIVLLAAAMVPVIYGPWRLTIGGMRILSIGRSDKALTLAVIALLVYASTLPAIVSAARRRSVLSFYALACFAMWMLALGPSPELFGRRALYEAPYGWLMRLPGFDGLRVPARFWMMSLVCLSVLAALAVHRARGRARQLAVGLAAAGLVLDGWPKSFTVLPEPERRPAPQGVFARLDLPISSDRDVLTLHQQVFEQVPLYNGFSGYVAPHYHAMEQMLVAKDPRILQVLAARADPGWMGVVVDHETDGDQAYRRFVMSYPGAVLVETHPSWSSYRLPSGAAGAPLPDRTGEPLHIKAVDALPSPPHAVRAIDGNLETRWSGGVQRAAAQFTIELDGPQTVGQVVVSLGPFWRDFPVRLRVEASPDGSAWQTVFEDGTALHAYYAAVRHPREMPLVVPVARDNVRFIRLTQLGFGPYDWSIAEVQVLR